MREIKRIFFREISFFIFQSENFFLINFLKIFLSEKFISKFAIFFLKFQLLEAQNSEDADKKEV